MTDVIWVDNLIKIFEYEIKYMQKVLEEAENKKNVIIKGDGRFTNKRCKRAEVYK